MRDKREGEERGGRREKGERKRGKGREIERVREKMEEIGTYDWKSIFFVVGA